MGSPNSPRLKKGKTGKLKIMLIIFSDLKGIVHKEFTLAGQTINFSYYCDVLQ
jgi:hypothetical protein